MPDCGAKDNSIDHGQLCLSQKHCDVHSDTNCTRVRTPGHVPKKTRWFFLGKPTFKNPAKKTQPNNQILMSYSTVIKKFFTMLKDVNV